MKLRNVLKIIFYTVSFLGILIQSYPAIDGILRDRVFEIHEKRTKSVGFHLPVTGDEEKNIKVTYQGDDFHGLFIREYEITNQSGIDISADSFETGIKVKFIGKGEIKVVGIDTINAKGEKRHIGKSDINQEEGVTIFEPHLINKGESLKVSVTSAYQPAEAVFESRILGFEGFKRVENFDTGFSRSKIALITSLLGFLISGFGVALSESTVIREKSKNLGLTIKFFFAVSAFIFITTFGQSFFLIFSKDDVLLYFCGGMTPFLGYFTARYFLIRKQESLKFFLWGMEDSENGDEDEEEATP